MPGHQDGIRQTAMNFITRDERPDDAAAIAALTEIAFRGVPYASGTESGIPARLRAMGALTLSLVAEDGGNLVGHAAFSPAVLDGDANWFGLGPVSVTPELQRAGIGSALIRVGLDRLRQAGAPGCVVVGDPNYYRRFGFASAPGLSCPGVPEENTMAVSFTDTPPHGEMAFHSAFFDAL